MIGDVVFNREIQDAAARYAQFGMAKHEALAAAIDSYLDYRPIQKHSKGYETFCRARQRNARKVYA